MNLHLFSPQSIQSGGGVTERYIQLLMLLGAGPVAYIFASPGYVGDKRQHMVHPSYVTNLYIFLVLFTSKKRRANEKERECRTVKRSL